MESQNGWPAGERATLNIVTVTVPGTQVRLPVLAGDVATVLVWAAQRWHHEVEPLVEPGNWGYAYRPIRGAVSGLSNHASGTAIDLNAPAHPLGVPPGETLSKPQVQAAKRIEADSGGVLRWGGSYFGRADAMHWEVNASPAEVAALAARITGPTAPKPKPVPVPVPTFQELDVSVRIAVGPDKTCWIATTEKVWWTKDVTEVAALAKMWGIPITSMANAEIQKCIDFVSRRKAESDAATAAAVAAAMPGVHIDETALAEHLFAKLAPKLTDATSLSEDDIVRLLNDSEVDTVNLLASRLVS